ncbi:MAG: ATP-binding cassette domain-containing protein [Anaerolineales bacterium]|nr:ATP-binding cassette domain-containing protein [Anaerolineales bacterium]
MQVHLNTIRKQFGAQGASTEGASTLVANDDITLLFEPGRIYGLLGENGAGKSTLMKILSGYQQPDSGEILLGGVVQHFTSPRQALAAGVGMLYQEPLDVPVFTVLENFLLGRAPDGQTPRQAATALVQLAQRYSFEVDPHERIETLSMGERQQLELLRLLAGGAQVLILDEPTTGISAEQKDLLFASMRTLAREEGKTLILVSHKLDEVQELCDHAYVLRKGRYVGGRNLPCPTAELVTLMFEQLPPRPERRQTTHTQKALELRSASVHTPRLQLAPASLQVQAGQVLGLAGLEGSGQELLLRACAGLLPLAAGSLWLSGERQPEWNYPLARQRGVGYLAAGRLEEGLIAGLTLTEHMALVSHAHGLLVDWPQNRQLAAEHIATYQVVGQPESAIETLSGGNQQRFLFAMLPKDLKLILMEHPTRGLDIRSTDWIWEQLDQRRANGTAIVFISADLDEVAARSDQIAVFSGGQLLRSVAAAETNADELGHLIGGAV